MSNNPVSNDGNYITQSGREVKQTGKRNISGALA